MPVQWAGLAPPLLVDVRRDAGLPLRAQLEARSARRDPRRAASRSASGCRPPASSPASWALSRGLVQECYGQLQAEGYLTGVVGSGTRVARRGAAAPAPRPRRPPRRRPAPPPRIDFASGVPDLAAFPREDWAWAMREACRTVAVADLDYGDPRGDAAAARGARGLPAAGCARRVADRDRVRGLLGVRPGPRRSSLRALARAGVRPVALEDPGNGDPARTRRPARRCGSAARCCPCPSTSTASTSTRSPPPAPAWSW